MSFTSRFRGYFQTWLYGKKQRPLRRRSYKAPLCVELLEDRTLLSTLPAPVVGSTATILTNGEASSAQPYNVSPTEAIDPLDPTKMVEINATFLNTGNPKLWILQGEFSSDEGKTWTPFGVAAANVLATTITDPATFTPDGGYNKTVPFTQISDPNVAFDRNNNFYVVASYHNDPTVYSTSSGELVFYRFSFTNASTGPAPVSMGSSHTDPVTGAYDQFDTVLYRWYAQDPAANPVIGIDDNQPTFTDPTTGAVQTDTMATMVSIPAFSDASPTQPATLAYPADLVPKGIYVAYNVNQTYPQFYSALGETNPVPQESRVFVMASADGGREFTNQELVSSVQDFMNAIPPSEPNTPTFPAVPQTGTEAADPQIVFTQGTSTTPGGQVLVFYDNYFTNYDEIEYVVTRPDGGLASTPVAAAKVFSDTTDQGIIGAMASTATGTGGNTGNIPGVTDDPINVNLKGGDIDSTNMTSVDDLTVTVSIVEPTMADLLVVLVPPVGSGLPSETLVLNQINAAGQTLPGGGAVPQGLSIADLGSLPTPGTPTNPSWTPIGTVFDDNAPRVINDPGQIPGATGTTVAPLIGHFEPEAGSLLALVSAINAAGLSKAKGVWNLEITDFALPPMNMPQDIQSWSLNFTGRIATTTGSSPFSAGNGTNNVQQVLVNATGGSWTLAFNGATTAALPFNISAAALQTAIAGLNSVGPGNVLVTGGPTPLPYSITFQGLLGSSPQNAIIATGTSLTTAGGTGTPGTITVTTLSNGSFGTLGGLAGETGGISGFGGTNLVVADSTTGFFIRTIPGTWDATSTNPYPTQPPSAPAGTPGIGPAFSVAIDNTLGSFSPFEGRLYLAYTKKPSRKTDGTANDTDDRDSIVLLTSDNVDLHTVLDTLPTDFLSEGPFITTPADIPEGQVNDAGAEDNTTEGVIGPAGVLNPNVSTVRTVFDPVATVDPVTGTLGIMWYDARNDPQDTRVANYITFSIDGGTTFSPDTPINTLQVADNFYSGANETIGPIPDNMGMATFGNPATTVPLAGPYGFGSRPDDLIMYGGLVFPVWSGNLDATIKNAPGNSEIMTNTVTIAGGPRVLSGDMGPVTEDFNTDGSVYNNTFSADGTRELDGFVITYDRPVDPGSVVPSMVDVTYRDPDTPASAPGTDISDQITGILPLDLSASHGPNDPGTPPTISISDTIVQEPASNQTMAVFTVVLSQAVGTEVGVDWSTADGTGPDAAASTGPHPDYVASSGTAVFEPDQLTASFEVPVQYDPLFTNNRFFLVNLSNTPTSISIDSTRAQGMATIVNDKNIPAITVGNGIAVKHTGSFTYNAPGGPTQVSSTFTFGTTTTAAQLLGALDSMPALNGNVAVTGGTGGPFTITFSGTANASLLSFANLGQLGITSATSASFSTSPVLLFPVFLNQPASQNITVDYSTADGTGAQGAVSGTDYTGTALGTLTIPKGQTVEYIAVPVTNDETITGNLDFFLNLTNPVGASITRSQALGVIVDENQLAVSVGAVTVQRTATGSFTYNPPAGPAQVGTAFTVGPTTTTAQLLSALNSMAALNNNVAVTGNMGGPFTLTFSGGTSAALLQFSNPPQLSSTSTTTATFTTPQIANVTFLLNGVTSQNVTVNYETVNGTGTGGAVAGTDYTDATNTGTFTYTPAAGPAQVSSSFTFGPTTTVGQLTNVLNGVPALNGNVVVTGSTGGPFTLTFSGTANATLLQFSNPGQLNSTSTTKATFSTSANASVVIPAGSQSVTVPITILGNTTPESNKTFQVQVTSVVNAAATATSGSFTYNPPSGPAQASSTFTVGSTTTTAQVASALNSIPALSGHVVVTGSTGGPFTLTFSGGTSAALLQFSNPTQLSSTSTTTATFTTGVTVTIIDNNAVPALIVGDVMARAPIQNPQNIQVPVFLSFANPAPITITYATVADGANPATPTTDFNPPTTTSVTIAPGNTEFTIPVQLLPNLTDGPTNPTFGLMITGITSGNATIARATGLVTIITDNVEASVGDFTVNEPASGTAVTADFPVFLSGPSEQTVTVTLSTVDGTAVAGTDYMATTQTLTFLPGQTSQIVSVPVLNNPATTPPYAQFQLHATGMTIGGTAANLLLIKPNGTGTIVDTSNTASTIWSVGDISQLDPPLGTNTTTVNLPIFFNSAPSANVTVNSFTVTKPVGLTITGPPVPFTIPLTGPFTIPFTVNFNNVPSSPVANRTFTVTLTGVSAGTIARTTGTVTIVEGNADTINIGNTFDFGRLDPGNPIFSIPVIIANESPAIAAATPAPGIGVTPITVTGTYSTANGTATQPLDYTRILNQAFTDTSDADRFTLPVTVVNTTAPEGDAAGYETFTASLANTSLYATPGQDPSAAGSQGDVNIVDNNALNLSVGDAFVQDTPTGATMAFNVYLNGVSGAPVTFNWALQQGTARLGLDYYDPLGTGTIPAGSLMTTIDIPILPEQSVEGNRAFTITLSNSVGAGIQKGVATGTIMESQLTPTLTLSDPIVQKGPSGQQLETFTLFASYPIASAASPTGLPTTVTITPASTTLTGVSGDFVSTPFNVTLPAGASSMTFTIPVNGNTLPEGNETFRVTMSNPSNGNTLATRLAGQDAGAVGESLATIVDYNYVPIINIGDIVVSEAQGGQQTYNIPVILTRPSTLPVTVQVDTSDGGATESLAAAANSDYVPLDSEIVTIPAGTTTFDIPVTVIGHSFFIGDRAFTVTLSNPQNATVNKDQGTVTIIDGNDKLGATEFLVELKPQSAVGTYTYTVQPLASDRIRLAYNEGSPSLSIDNQTVALMGSSPSQVVFNLTLSQSSTQAITVQVNTSNGTAFAGTDYTAVNETVTFAPGTTTAAVTVPLIGTTATGPLKTFTLSASDMTVGGAAAPASAIMDAGTASIVNENDTSNTFWSIGDVTAADGSASSGVTTNFTFTIFTNKAFTAPQTIKVNTSNALGDYVPLVNDLVTLPAGATSTTVTVQVFTGLTLTSNIPFNVTLSAPSSGAVGEKPVGTGLILNNNNTFNATDLSTVPINWQAVAPVAITVGNTLPAQQNVPIDTASTTTFAPSVATSSIYISGIDPSQVLRDMTVTVNATFPDTSALEVELFSPDPSVPAFVLEDDTAGANFPDTVFDDEALTPIGNRLSTVVQTITVNATGGTFTISFGGFSTPALPWNASAAVVQSALQNLASIGAGNIAVTQAGNSYTLTFNSSTFGPAPAPNPAPALVGVNSSQLTGSIHTATAEPALGPQVALTNFRPVTPLSATPLPASALNGTWTLEIINSNPADFGVLNNWSLQIQTGILESTHLGNATNQVQNGFTANLTRNPTDIFGIPTPEGGVPLGVNVAQSLGFDSSVTGGSFTLSFDGQTTAPIPWNPAAAILQGNIQAALNALPTVGLASNGSPNALVSDANNPTIVFQNNLSGTIFPLSINTTQLAGGSATIGEDQTQTLTFDGVTGGTFTVSFNGRSTAPLNWTSDTSVLQGAIQSALGDLVTVGQGNALVTSLTTETITFTNLLNGTTLPLSFNTSNLGGGTATLGGYNSNILIFNGITGGTFTISFNGQTTATINWSPDPSILQGNIQAALNALTTVGTGNASVAYASAENITFENTLENTTVPLILSSANLVGGTPAVGGRANFVTVLTAPFDPNTLPLIIPGPHEDTLKYSTADVVQTLTFDPGVTGGAFTLTFNGQTSVPIAWNANTQILQGNIQGALNALSTVLLGNAVVSNAASPTITFVNALAGTNIGNLTVSGAGLVGGSAHLVGGDSQTLIFGAGLTGGTFTLSYSGQTTAPIAWSASSAILQANIQAALNALSTIGAGNTVVSNANNPTITFQNNLNGTSIPITLNAAGLGGASADIGDGSVETLLFGAGLTGGTFTLTFNGQTTAPIAWSASAASLRSSILSALNALSSIGSGKATVSSAADPTITFASSLTGVLTLNGTGLVGGTAGIEGGASAVIGGLARATVGTLASPLNFQIPRAVINPANNTYTPGVLNVPLVVANAPSNTVITNLDVRVDIEDPVASDLTLTLIGPNGTSVELASGDGLGGPNFDGTTFDDGATLDSLPLPISAGLAPFQGTFIPAEPLSAFDGININGTWTLQIKNAPPNGTAPDNDHGEILYWQLIPTSTLILNQTSSYTDVVFDREINPNSINTTNIVNMLGPVGAITGPFTLTPNPTVPGTNTPVYPPEYANRVFRISFPVQQYSGSYSLELGPVNNPVNLSLNKTIDDVAGNAIDNNLNAGVYVLEGTSPSGGTVTSKTYNSSAPSETFGPGAAAFSTITVPDNFIITQSDVQHIQVEMQLNDQNTPDLVATLTPPSDTGLAPIVLFSNVGVFGAAAGLPHPDLGNSTVLDDFGSTPIQDSSVGLLGTFNPQEPLSRLIGVNAAGTWTLTITNESRGENPSVYGIGAYNATLVQWSLSLPGTVPSTGLGEPVADDVNTSFRLFTMSPTNILSSSTWTAIGPAPETGGETGPVGALVVDPTDPSGNTVYVGASKGGIWKTYDFLTTDPNGPTWIPLTNLGPLDSLNIGALAIVPAADGNPNQSIIIAGTGDMKTTNVGGSDLQPANGATSTLQQVTNTGVGFLISTDGGNTWVVVDSTSGNVTTNASGQVVAEPINSATRNHLFDGTFVNQIAVDPVPVNGKYVIYAAIAVDPNAPLAASQGGLWRSTDSGLDWTRMEQGVCTSVVLAAGSGSGGGTGPLQGLYAGFETGLGTTGGVYYTSSALSTGTNSLLPVPNNGSGQPGSNQGVNSRVNIDNITNPVPPAPYPVIAVGPSNTPSGTTTPVILATPGKTNNPLEDALYQGWVYAYTNNTLFETKDFGQNWTQVNLPYVRIPANTGAEFPTDDSSQANYTSSAFFDSNVTSLAIDANDPNILYIGGLELLRVDLTNVSDVYSYVNFSFTNPTGIINAVTNVGDVQGPKGAGELENAFTDVLEVNPTSTLTNPAFISPNSPNVIDLLRDPQNPFLNPSSLQFTGTTNFANDGSGVQWQFVDYDTNLGSLGDENQIVDIKDPLTGGDRVINATTTGIYSAVLQSNGDIASIDTGIGAEMAVSGDRNGNLQISQIIQTGSQPSTLAADVAGSFLYAENTRIGVATSDPNLFEDGNIAWGTMSLGWGQQVSADPTGSGIVFKYQDAWVDRDTGTNLLELDGALNGNDFFQVNPVGTIPSPTSTISADRNDNVSDSASVIAPGTTSATTGLIQGTDDPNFTGNGQWPGQYLNDTGSTFAINALGNPGDYQGMVMSSQLGRIFRASGDSLSAGVGGIVWQDIGDPSSLDGKYAAALAFGAPPNGVANVDDWIYAGTLGGHIYVTFTGGGSAVNWKNISTGLDGSQIEAISPDPVRGSTDVFALTQEGIYYCANAAAAAPVWVRLDDTTGKGYIFPGAGQTGILRPVWNNLTDMVPAFDATDGFTSLAVDWRYAIPNASGGGTHPEIYVGGDGGVVASTNLGASWSIFPPLSATNPLTQTGGYLPSIDVTGLQLIAGNVSAVTGLPNSSSGLDTLVASTLGEGDFAIRLTPIGSSVVPHSSPTVSSVTPLTGSFGETLTGLTVTFNGAVDPTSFTTAGVNYVHGPGGQTIPVKAVLDATPPPAAGTGSLNNIYNLVFATPQTANGTYTVSIGPNITDGSGDVMSKSFQGSTTFTANTPPVVGANLTQQTPGGAVINVTLAQPITTFFVTPGAPVIISFTVSDATDAASTLTITPPPSSSDQLLVPDGNIVVGSLPGTNGAGHTLTITPTSAQSGAAFITLNVTDPHGATTTETFEIAYDVPITVTPISSPQTVAHGQTLTLPFTITSGGTPTVTVSAVATSAVVNLDAALQLYEEKGTYYFNSDGLYEKWVRSKTNGKYYIIEPSGKFSVWNGGKSFTPVTTDPQGDPLVLDYSYWLDPTKLTAPVLPAVTPTATYNAAASTLSITAPLTYAGLATVKVTADDGVLSSSLTFQLIVTNSPPTFNQIGTTPASGGTPVLSVPPAQTTVTLNLGAAAPAGYGLTDHNVTGPDDVVTLDTSKVYAANAAGYAYELAQTLELYFTGNYYSSGTSQKWIRGAAQNAWYTISNTGVFSLWNGGTSYTQLAVLDSSYWQDPTKLINAVEPPSLPNIAVNDTTHVVTLNPITPEIVKIAAFDGLATTTRFFIVNVANSPPTFNVPDQQFAHNAAGNPQLTINLTNQPASPAGAINLTDNNALPVTSTLQVFNYAPAEAYNLSTTLNLQFNTSYYQDNLGLDEKWLYSQATKTWYVIEPNGNFSKWNGGKSITLVANLGFSYWSNPASLIDISDGQHVVAPTPLASTAAFTFGDVANVLSFNTNGTVNANYLATVTAIDTLSSTTHSFKLSVTDAAPVFSVTAPLPNSISHNSSYTATIPSASISDADGDTPTFTANVYPYVPGFAYQLQQTYQFYAYAPGNYFSSGTAQKWFRSAVNNSWYVISSTGVVSKWNGASSYTVVGTLDASYYGDPTKLFNAQAPAPLNPSAITAALTGSNATGYSLALTPISTGGHLLVQVTASDAAASSSQYFDFTVTSPTVSFAVTPLTPSTAFTNSATASVTGISAAPDPVGAVTFSASVYSLIPGLAYQLDLQKAFYFTGTYYLNSSGLNEKWLKSQTDNLWYIIEPTGKLSVWNGGKSFTQVVADGVPVVLGFAYYNDPSLLYNAVANPPPDLTVPANGTFTYAFTGSNATGLTLTVNPNSQNAGDFLVQVKGSDAGAVTSQFYKQTFSDFAPTFGQPADQSVPHSTHTYTLDLTNPAVVSPVLTYTEGNPPGSLATVTLGVKAYYATAAATAYMLNSELSLYTTGNYYLNSSGLGEKWVRSQVTNLWYIIQPNGAFSVWNGGKSFTFVAQLDSTYFANPTTLFTAPEPATADLVAPPPTPTGAPVLTTPAVTSYSVDNVHHTVTINTDPNFVGTLLVKVTASDQANLSTSQFFHLSLTSLPPTLTFNPPGTQNLSKNGTPLNVELVGNDPDSGNSQPLTYNVSLTDASAAAQAFALEQAQNLYVDGSLFPNFYGFNEIWLRSHTTGAWYGITPDGNVHLLNPNNLLGPVVATLNPSYYTNYQLLINAPAQAAPPVTTSLTAAGDPSNPLAKTLTLTWTNPALTGTFLVTVTVTNSIGASVAQTFLVNVS